MFNISSYLEKFSKKINSEEEVKQILSRVIKSETGLDLGFDQIEIKNYIAHINASQAFLNKIFISKNRILEEYSKISQVKVLDIK